MGHEEKTIMRRGSKRSQEERQMETGEKINEREKKGR